MCHIWVHSKNRDLAPFDIPPIDPSLFWKI
jgi:hypothetical protein